MLPPRITPAVCIIPARLNNSSTANILRGGYVSNARVYGDAVLRVLEYRYTSSGAGVNWASVYNSGRVELVNGGINHLRTHDSGQVSLSGGFVNTVYTNGNSIIAANGSSISELRQYDNSYATVTNGQIGTMYLYNLSLNGPERAVISGGTVGTLHVFFNLTGNDHVSFFGDITPFGVTVTGGVVETVTASFSLSENSRLGVSDGQISNIYAWGSNIVSIDGGTISSLNAFGNSSMTIDGGRIAHLNVSETSTVTILSGQISTLTVADTFLASLSDSETINPASYDYFIVDIFGGSIDEMLLFGHGTMTIHALDFELSGELSLIGDTLSGTGVLSGTWIDGTEWSTQIAGNQETVNLRIVVIPEPAALFLLGFGGFALRRKQRG